ncbi:MAG: hypothetical protein ACRED1_02020, partial [Limisphaerales bacterium]
TGDQATTIDISSVSVTASSIVALMPASLGFQIIGNHLQLSWPEDHLGWTLQTNSAGLAATNAWFPYPGSTSVTNVAIPVDSAATNVFFRLIYSP